MKKFFMVVTLMLRVWFVWPGDKLSSSEHKKEDSGIVLGAIVEANYEPYLVIRYDGPGNGEINDIPARWVTRSKWVEVK